MSEKGYAEYMEEHKETKDNCDCGKSHVAGSIFCKECRDKLVKHNEKIEHPHIFFYKGERKWKSKVNQKPAW